MGAYKRDVVVVIKMGAYIRGVLILCESFIIPILRYKANVMMIVHKMQKLCSNS